MSDPTGPSEEEQFRAMLTLCVSLFLDTGDDEATEARELAADAATVDDAAFQLKVWFTDRASDATPGRVSPECLADVWPGMAYQAMPLVDWVGLAHKIRNPDIIGFGRKIFGE
jgi:hypothetical protein